MKSNLDRAVTLIGILFLVTLAGATHAHAQVPPPSTQNSLTAIPDMPGPAIGEQFTELSAGIFTYSKTDLSLPGPMPINVTRVYRSGDKTSGNWNNRAFGLGTRLNYDMFVSGESVSMPDSSMLNCTGSAPAYTCNSQPSGVWFGSVLEANNTLTRPDGTVYSFDPTTGLLLSIKDLYSNTITISSGPSAENTACHSQGASGSVPSGYVGTVTSSNGRAVYFCYDDPNNPTDITGIADNASGGPIKKVTYAYSNDNQLQTVTQTNYSSDAVTTYQWNQGNPAPGGGDITTIIVNDECTNLSITCGSPNQVLTNITYVVNNLGTAVKSISSQLPGNGYTYNYNNPSGYPASHVTVNLPDNATRDFYFDPNGYVTKDERNVGQSNPEYTWFNRGQQTVGTSQEFVGEVLEYNSAQNQILRQTKYNYDTNAGNVLSVTLCPAPGQSAAACIPGTTPTATWNYTYTTYNLLASAVEPLDYNGVGTKYAYLPVGSPPTSMTVTDQLERVTTVDYNAQGQPTSVEDPIGNTAKIQYYSVGYSTGDIEWVMDPTLNKTTYVTDPDGRVKSVTSPLNEETQYSYDAIDDVTEVIDPMNNITCNTYNLLGMLQTTTPPRGVNGSCSNITSGFTTTVTRNASLAKTTVTDPLTKNTITNLDGQGRHTDYTDKRGVKTTYTYDKFGRVTEAFFNSNNLSAYPQDMVTTPETAFDPLDRTLTLSDSLSTSTLTYSYDSLDSVLSESDSLTNDSATYSYDPNGRRTSLQPTMNKAAQPTINYGYDCADELISMSNNGSSLQSCSSSNYFANGGTSTQVGINYDLDGNPNYTVVDGVQTVLATSTSPRDADERVKVETFQAYPSLYSYGGLTYKYDPDGHLVDKGAIAPMQAVVNMPAAASASYSATDQVSSWNNVSSATDDASNLTTDPASGLTLTWTARNQMATATEASEVYDGLGRREQSEAYSYTQSFLHDGGSVLGWSDSSGNFWDFLNLPGAGSLAGSDTVSGTTTTWVPLLDAAGSTIALVNAASTGSPPAGIYTYDPFGSPTVSGTANYWPFQYQGLEKESTDASPYYYTGSGQFYSPQMVRSLSETSQTSSQGGGPSGGSIAAPSGGGNGSFGNWLANDEENNLKNYFSFGNLGVAVGDSESGFIVPVGAIAEIVEQWISFFDWLFGSSGPPPTPRKLLHQRHPLYPEILGVQDGLIPDEVSDPVPAECDVAEPSSSGGTLALTGALGAAAGAEALGGGPENPAADLLAAGILVYGGATVCYEAYQSYAKGGKQNLRESGQEGLSDEEISARAHDPSLPPQERRKYQRLEKVKKLRNKRKRQ